MRTDRVYKARESSLRLRKAREDENDDDEMMKEKRMKKKILSE